MTCEINAYEFVEDQLEHPIYTPDCDQTSWTLLDVPDLATARKLQAMREGIPINGETDIGFADCVSGQTHGLETDTITTLGPTIGQAGVVWTNLPCKFNGQQVMPGEAEVIAFLAALDAINRASAERYVRQAPPQNDTLYRQAIEREFGWFESSTCVALELNGIDAWLNQQRQAYVVPPRCLGSLSFGAVVTPYRTSLRRS